jgi:hypothetical protein
VTACGVVAIFPDYRTEMYCVSCEVRTTERICHVEESRTPSSTGNFPKRTSIRDMHQVFHIAQKSYKIMKMHLFVILNKAKPNTLNIRGLNLEAVMCMTVQVSRLSL